LTPLPLRTVRPFVIEEIVLADIADDENLDLNDQIAITQFLKAKVNALIDKANALWDERNAQSDVDEAPLPRMLPLVRLKVDTTGVSETANPIRFGQAFQGRLANPRDLLVFHRAKRAAARGASGKVAPDEPALSIDDPALSAAEKLAKVRVGTLVREYLAAQELQLLGEGGMSEAIRMFVEKDDVHAIQTCVFVGRASVFVTCGGANGLRDYRHVSKALKTLMKSVQPNGDAEMAEDDVEDLVRTSPSFLRWHAHPAP
jgi:double-strand break repair protein MRE11